eukprot:6212989-Pleurochrysis_carterae.AAC.1
MDRDGLSVFQSDCSAEVLPVYVGFAFSRFDVYSSLHMCGQGTRKRENAWVGPVLMLVLARVCIVRRDVFNNCSWVTF